MEKGSIIVENITKKFNIHGSKKSRFSLPNAYDKKFTALENVSFQVSPGEMLGIIGFNGSGKTTLLRLLAEIFIPDSGRIETSGKIAPLLQLGVGFQNELGPIENIGVTGRLLGFTKSEINAKIPKILEFAELEKFTNLRIKQFSSGMKARLGFSIAIELNPDILLIDEILSVGDRSFREKSFNAFLSFKEKKKTILLASHNLESVSRLCDKVLLINNGKVLKFGPPKEVISEFVKLKKTR